jgi:acetyl-CoA C-acetyltransferase
MSIRGQAYIAGAFEHPRRKIDDRSAAQVHAEVAAGALTDAGLTFGDVDGYFCAGDAPGGFTYGDTFGPLSMIEYLGIRPAYMESTETGGASYVAHVAHAAAAIALGKCSVALITLGGSSYKPAGVRSPAKKRAGPESQFLEIPWGLDSPASSYALAASRHMHEFGTTSAELAEIKVAASVHASHNPHALLPKQVTVEDVLNSPVISTPLHRLDSCVRTDGGGALVVVAPHVARSLGGRLVKVLGHGEAAKHGNAGRIDLTHTAAVWSGPRAFDEAGLVPGDVDYVSIYDSFTITVLLSLEDLGFCAKGSGGRFVRDGRLIAGEGSLPFNTDGGGLCNNHPAARGGMTKVIEAVRQLRGDANDGTQVADCQIALINGTGGTLATRSASATLILGQEDA